MQNSYIAQDDFPLSENQWPRVSDRSIAQSLSGYLVPLNSLAVTFGTAYGDELVSVGDFIPGDALKLAKENATVSIRFDDWGARDIKVVFPRAEVGQRVIQALVAKSLTLMSGIGQVVYARVLQVLDRTNARLFVLLEETLDPSVEYTLVEVSD